MHTGLATLSPQWFSSERLRRHQSPARPARRRETSRVEAEAGDETEVADLFDLDRTEARALGVELDRADRGESQLD